MIFNYTSVHYYRHSYTLCIFDVFIHCKYEYCFLVGIIIVALIVCSPKISPEHNEGSEEVTGSIVHKFLETSKSSAIVIYGASICTL